ncbi:MAG TPA: DUF3099 domain-containing protein [Streptosporangiaceae bacterium]|nr:DUF3099 domain-containing protein [Streptosporangiaceae bacterium]
MTRREGGGLLTRNRAYFLLMGVSITLVVVAWAVVRLYSVTAAIIMSVAAGVIPPIAAIVANAGDEASRRQ